MTSIPLFIPVIVRWMERFMEELMWMSTVLRYGRTEVRLDKKQDETTMVHHANKPCPEMVARMGTDAIATVLQVSQSSQIKRVEGNPIGCILSKMVSKLLTFSINGVNILMSPVPI
jgi:hypothetical protein